MKPQLSILICTINDRIKEVPGCFLSSRDDVRYIVSFQFTDKMFLDMVPNEIKERPDVELIAHPSTGLSRNRNMALSSCQTELALIADDDVRYTHEQLNMVIRTFRDHPDVDIACFQTISYTGLPHKHYPTHSFDYAHTPKGYYYSSVEIALRCDVQLPWFDTRFGLGSPYLACGEEDVFLFQSHCIGLHIRYFPELLCKYQSDITTGERFMTSPRVRRSMGAVYYVVYGLIGGFLRIIKKALSTRGLRCQSFSDMLDGYKYILRS